MARWLCIRWSVWEMLLSHFIRRSSRWTTKREAVSKYKCVVSLLHRDRCCTYSADMKTSLAHRWCKGNEIALRLRLKSDGTGGFHSSLFLHDLTEQWWPPVHGCRVNDPENASRQRHLMPLMWGVRCFNEASTTSMQEASAAASGGTLLLVTFPWQPWRPGGCWDGSLSSFMFLLWCP